MRKIKQKIKNPNNDFNENQIKFLLSLNQNFKSFSQLSKETGFSSDQIELIIEDFKIFKKHINSDDFILTKGYSVKIGNEGLITLINLGYKYSPMVGTWFNIYNHFKQLFEKYSWTFFDTLTRLTRNINKLNFSIFDIDTDVQSIGSSPGGYTIYQIIFLEISKDKIPLIAFQKEFTQHDKDLTFYSLDVFNLELKFPKNEPFHYYVSNYPLDLAKHLDNFFKFANKTAYFQFNKQQEDIIRNKFIKFLKKEY